MNNNQIAGGSLQFYGGFKLHYLPKFVAPVLMITCIICYYVAVSTGERPPFPKATITQTAEEFPQDILFRYTNLFASSIVGLMWLTMYYVLRGTSIQLGNKVPITTWIIWLGEIGVIFYGIAVATIDNGKMADSLHGTSAVIFFIMWAINMCLVTFAYYQLKQISPDVIGDFSLFVKIVTCIGMIILWVVEIIIEITPKELRDDQVDIIEWGSMFFLLVFIYTFTWDWKNYTYQFGQSNLSECQVQQQPQQQFLQLPLVMNGCGNGEAQPIYLAANQTISLNK